MSLLRTFADEGVALQQTFDAAVVIPTILRPELADALASVFTQDLRGRIQVLVGIDAPRGDIGVIEAACVRRPANCVVQVYYPGYSTSVRHGGLCPAQDGGVLRTALSLLANSPRVAYLDDDNWWHPAHLRLLCGAIRGLDYAYNLRWFVHPRSRQIVARDDYESLGPGKGVFSESFGGFIDPNCLMLDRLRCADVLAAWMQPLLDDGKGMCADRTVFKLLASRYTGACTNLTTVYYRLDPRDEMHVQRMTVMGKAYAAAGG